MSESAEKPRKEPIDAAGTGLFIPRYLRRLGKPAWVIDVGVNEGTPHLYRAFPQAKFILVDPQNGGDSRLKRKPQSYVFANVAVGAAPGTVTIHEQAGRSTALERTALTRRGEARTYEAPVTTLDALIEEHGAVGPIGLKIDTEGYELEVLKGLQRHADAVAFIICEASIRRRFVGGYTFCDMAIAMKDRGFEFYNFLNPPKPQPNFYDAVFLPAASPLFD